MSRRKFLPPAAVGGVKGPGHDVRGARAAVSAGVGAAVAAPAHCVRHGPAPGEELELHDSPWRVAAASGDCHQFHGVAGGHRFPDNGSLETSFTSTLPITAPRPPNRRFPRFSYRSARNRPRRMGIKTSVILGRVPFAHGVPLFIDRDFGYATSERNQRHLFRHPSTRPYCQHFRQWRKTGVSRQALTVSTSDIGVA